MASVFAQPLSVSAGAGPGPASHQITALGPSPPSPSRRVRGLVGIHPGRTDRRPFSSTYPSCRPTGILRCHSRPTRTLPPTSTYRVLRQHKLPLPSHRIASPPTLRRSLPILRFATLATTLKPYTYITTYFFTDPLKWPSVFARSLALALPKLCSISLRTPSMRQWLIN